MNRRMVLFAAAGAAVVGVALGIVLTALNLGIWPVYGVLVFAGLLIAGIATQMSGPFQRQPREVPGGVTIHP
jgi:ABC-type Mn2+/Zn2+ transport system permease subunit